MVCCVVLCYDLGERAGQSIIATVQHKEGVLVVC